jgi:uncharacterized protein YjbI with pentapeptide repeats
MANPEHLRILEQGVEAWNEWRSQNEGIRPDLREADLSDTNLSEANLSEANLASTDFSRANLTRANLTEAAVWGAFLTRAILTQASLARAQLIHTTFAGANLSETDLLGAYFLHTTLVGADFSGAGLSETVFSNTDLTDVRGLETCIHLGPSVLDHRTLAKSGPLHVDFLRGCGLRDWEIEGTKLYQPGLTPTDIEAITSHIHALRADVQYYSCFISHARRDEAFTKRLHADLRNKGVPCWYAPEDMKAGDRIRDTIEQQIRRHEKLLVVLSSASIASRWVENEVEAALEEEQTSPEGRTVLVPIKIDDAVKETDRAWARTIKRMRHIRDFTHWHDDGEYKKAFDGLLGDLKAAERQPEGERPVA